MCRVLDKWRLDSGAIGRARSRTILQADNSTHQKSMATADNPSDTCGMELKSHTAPLQGAFMGQSLDYTLKGR